MQQMIDLTNNRLKDPKYRKLLVKNLPAEKFVRAAEYVQYVADRKQLLAEKKLHQRYQRLILMAILVISTVTIVINV